MPLRPATRADVPEIHALIRELAEYERLTDQMTATPEDLGRQLFDTGPAASVTIATTATDEIAGFALWFPTFSTFLGKSGIWLEDLYVRPRHRGQGHGRALLEHLRGLTDGRVEWAVLDWNEPAITFYKNLGARSVDGWTIYRWLPGSRDSPDG